MRIEGGMVVGAMMIEVITNIFERSFLIVVGILVGVVNEVSFEWMVV